MRGKMRRVMDAWGHYFLALLCAGVILLSAHWTKTAPGTDDREARAAADQSQRLQEAQEEGAGLAWPVQGEILAGVEETAAFYPRYSLWHTHPGIDFAAESGTEIRCMAPGRVTRTADWVEIALENGDICRYYGAAECLVEVGQAVKAGEILGKSGAAVHPEGDTDCVCVVLLRNGKPVDFSGELIDKKGK